METTSGAFGIMAQRLWELHSLPEFHAQYSRVELGQPSGTLTSWDKSFNWTGLSGATWYNLEVQTSGGTPVLDDWYLAGDGLFRGSKLCGVACWNAEPGQWRLQVAHSGLWCHWLWELHSLPEFHARSSVGQAGKLRFLIENNK